MKQYHWDRRRADCTKCGGSGIYRWGLNLQTGRHDRHEGQCFQCKGKGWTSRRDEARTSTYWLHRAISNT